MWILRKARAGVFIFYSRGTIQNSCDCDGWLLPALQYFVLSCPALPFLPVTRVTMKSTWIWFGGGDLFRGDDLSSYIFIRVKCHQIEKYECSRVIEHKMGWGEWVLLVWRWEINRFVFKYLAKRIGINLIWNTFSCIFSTVTKIIKVSFRAAIDLSFNLHGTQSTFRLWWVEMGNIEYCNIHTICGSLHLFKLPIKVQSLENAINMTSSYSYWKNK